MGNYKEGMQVFGKWKGGNVWFRGTVMKIDGKKIDVKYEDGDREWTDSRLIQKDKAEKTTKISKFSEGDRIIGNWKGGKSWYPGKILKIESNKIHVEYNDGDKELIDDLKKIQPDKNVKAVKISKLAVGDKIKARWKGGVPWYTGTITELSKEKVNVLYDDGDTEWVGDLTLIKKIKLLKISKLKVGDRIRGNWKGSGTWYNGKITKIDGSKVHVQYDDGDAEFIDDLSKLQKIK